MRISLEDVINLPPDQVLQKMRQETTEESPTLQQKIAQAVENPNQPEDPSVSRTSEKKEPTPSHGIKELFDTNILKSQFAPDTDFKKGLSININGIDYTVVGVVASAGRVKFKNESNGVIRSVPICALTGTPPVSPFVKGQKVMLDGIECEVRRLNPANNNAVVFINGQFKYVKVTKLVEM